MKFGKIAPTLIKDYELTAEDERRKPI